MKALEVSFSSSSPSDLLRPLAPLGWIENYLLKRFLNICKHVFLTKVKWIKFIPNKLYNLFSFKH